MFETESVFKVGGVEIENLINEHIKTDKHREVEAAKYGNCDYELPCYEEQSNNTSIDFDVEASDPDEYDQKKIDEAFAFGRWPHYLTGTFLNMLCKKGIIPAGNYIVSIRRRLTDSERPK